MVSMMVSDKVFLSALSAGKRSDATVAKVAAGIRGASAVVRVRRGLWAHVRTTVDGLDKTDLATEIDVTVGRVSQITTPVARIVASGIGLPRDTDDLALWADLYAHVYRIAKAGSGASKILKEAAEAIDKIEGRDDKVAAWMRVEPPVKKDNGSREGRPGDGASETDQSPATLGVFTEAPSTFVEALATLALVAGEAEIADADLVEAMAYADRISDALARRLDRVQVKVAA